MRHESEFIIEKSCLQSDSGKKWSLSSEISDNKSKKR